MAALAHETNTFSPVPSTLRSFERGVLYRPGDRLNFSRAKEFTGYGDAMAVLAEEGDEMIEGTCAWAQPSGPVSRQTYELLRDEILAQVRAAGKIDAVLLTLHGAMVADGYPDCEGDLLIRVREVVGSGIPVGALLDLHGNVSPAMVESGAVLVACKEYPHTDYLPRTRELHAMLAAVARGGSMPLTIMKRVPMMALLGTTTSPMREFVRRIEGSEGKSGVLSVSAMQGFAWSDTSITGASILVVHEAADEAATNAALLASSLADEFFDLRASGVAVRLPVEEALDEVASLNARAGLVVLADGSDNAGGGAASDSTFLLRALLNRGARDAALGMIWDPQAVAMATDAGPGARLPLRIGGKVGPMSGDPVDVEAEVLSVREDARQRGLGGFGFDPIGAAVAIRVGGIDVVINSIRQQVFSPECFTEMGVDLSSKKLVVVKSTQHFRAGFDPISTHTVYCNAPGTLNGDLGKLPYRNISRPIWPLDPLKSVRDDGVPRS